MEKNEMEAAVRATKLAVRYALALIAVVVFLILLFATDLPKSFSGTGKQQAFIVAMTCAIPAFILYWPLSWAAGSAVRRKLPK